MGNATTKGGYYSCSDWNTSHHVVLQPNIALMEFKYEEVIAYLTLTLFTLFVIILKIIYHKMGNVATYLPESLLLIVTGSIFGAVYRYAASPCLYSNSLRLSPTLFFNILLPPIMLESAYAIYNRKFAEILGNILLYAAVGTVLNFLLIGVGLYVINTMIGFGTPDLNLGLKEYLLFASLIVAVDPVAVLAIFQDIGVDLGLYYIVFGESLLNDAVTVVLYNIMSAFVASASIEGKDIAVGISSFFTVSFGGAFIGVLHGVFSCLVTRVSVTSSSPVVLLLTSYLAYMVADLFAWSGIIAIIVCGVIQAAYAFHNLTPISVMLLKAALKQISGTSEAIIFLLLGTEIFATQLEWHTGFILSSLVITVVSRFIIVFILAIVINMNQSNDAQFKWNEQIIVGYGGLRGAVAFSLAVLLNPHFLGKNGELARDVYVTTTLFIILFTVAIMGTTIKPLVKLLDIRLARKEKRSLFVTLNNSVMEQTLVSLEQVVDVHGAHWMRRSITRIDDTYIRPILQRYAATHEKKIVNEYEKMNLQIHSKAIRSHVMRDHTAVYDANKLIDIPKVEISLNKATLNSDVDSCPRSTWYHQKQARLARTMSEQVEEHVKGAEVMVKRKARLHRQHAARSGSLCNQDRGTLYRPMLVNQQLSFMQEEIEVNDKE